MRIRRHDCNTGIPTATPKEMYKKSTPLCLFGFLATVILASGGLSSCAGIVSPSQGQPQKTATLMSNPISVSFAGVSVGSTAVQSLSITNTGTAVANISQETMSGVGLTAVTANPTPSIAAGG